jgi:hypothetical protein
VLDRIGLGLTAVAAALFSLAPSAGTGTLKITVHDARDRMALTGAWVQVGPFPGVPFSGNSAATNGAGSVFFDDPDLSGPQTVTAAAAGFARLTLIAAAVDSVTLRLQPEIADTTLYGAKAELSGTVSGIAVANNDGNLDIGLVYPSFSIGDVFSGGALPIEAPLDTVTFPLVGEVVLPGNVVLPNQTEGLFFLFSKPNYHFFVPDHRTYDFLCVSGRAPLAALTNPDPRNSMAMREIGVERQIAVNGNRTLTVNSDIDLTVNLTLTMPEAPVGSEMQVFSLADIAEPLGTQTYFYDSKTGIAGTTTQFLLSGRNPMGDLSTSVPFIAGVYGDSSAADAWGAGRVDRTPLVLPATRTVGAFFNLPDLMQSNDHFAWSDVARPGVTPDPTWAVATFRLSPITPGDSTVTTRTLWEVWTAASSGSFALPHLDPAAPGGIMDAAETPDADQLTWDELVGDPGGPIQQVLDDPYSSATRFSRRTVPISRPVTAVPPEGGSARAALRFLAPSPNPFHETTRLRIEVPSEGWLSVRVYDPAGRLVAVLMDGRVAPGPVSLTWSGAGGRGKRAPAGVYFVRATTGGQSVVRRVVLR